MEKVSTHKFDPEEHQNNVYEAFGEFVEEFAYEYDAIAKEPPKDLDDPAKTAWIQQNKRKVFLGKFATRNLQKNFEEAVAAGERSTITFDAMVIKLNEHYDGGRNKTLSNFDFHKLCQTSEESFDAFTIRVKREAAQCDFKCASQTCNVKDTLIRDQIIIGTTNSEVRKNALKNQWQLNDLIKNGRALEAATWGAEQIKQEQAATAASVSRIKQPGKYSRKNNRNKIQPTQFKTSNKDNSTHTDCTTCSSKFCKGGKHCTAQGRECFDCGKEGHFRGASSCKNKKKPSSRRVSNKVQSSDSSDEEQHTPDSSSSEDSDTGRAGTTRRTMKHVTRIRRMRRKEKHVRRTVKPPRYEVDVVINGEVVSAFADTGADISVMSKERAKALGLKLCKTKMKIRPYGSKAVRCKGCYVGTIMHGDQVVNACIYVVNQKVETLLSGKVCEELGIIEFTPKPVRRATADACPHKNRLRNAFPKVFEDKVGRLKDYKVKLYVDENVKPVAERRRSVPVHLLGKRNKELAKMEADGLIEEHDGPAPWISNPVLTPKDDGGTRVTIDMRNVNNAIQPTNIPIPRVEEIKSELAGCKVFSKLDFKSAFHQLEIDEESRYLTVFHGDGRLMRYCVLTMGSTPASGELTKALRPLFQHIKEVHVIHDDIIIATTDDAEHERVLNLVLKIIERSGMTLNIDKCIFSQSEVPFWGVKVNKDGIRPDTEKVKALKYATRPHNKQELISFLCMVQSNRDFIPFIAKKSSHLRMLTKKSKQFKWSKDCQREFEELKEAFSEDMLMNHFDPNKNTFIQVDAHRSGLSAILMQGDTLDEAKPVACASRATTPVEQRYPQLDLEALAVDFGLRRFRYYCVGGPTVTIITDHKPLLGVFGNTRHGSIRSDRIKLRHQDVRFKLVWMKGSTNPADFMSRHGTPYSKLSNKRQRETTEFEKTVWFLQFSPYTEAISMEKIIKETEQDPVLSSLKEYIRKGYIPKSDKTLKPYRKVFQELTLSDEELILKSEKILLPQSLYHVALEKAHQGGHPGMNGLKRRLRSHFWFPKMDSKIESKVASCKHCTMFTNKTTREPMQPHKTSDVAWKDVSVDLFGPMPDRQHVVAVIDKSSRFPAAKIIPNTSNTAVTSALRDIYADFGQPDTHQTDNGPPFNSDGFAKFSSDNGIQHVKTYPYHPQGNPVENFMRPIGKCMKAAHHQKTNKKQALNDMLSSYRATPHPSTGIAPGNMIFRSGYKKDFPRTTVENDVIKAALTSDREGRAQKGQLANMSNHRMHSEIVPNQMVFVRNNERKKFDPIFGPALYKVIDVKGNGAILLRITDSTIFRRHLDDIKDASAAVSSPEEGTCWIEEPNIPPVTVEENPPAGTGRPQRERRQPPYYSDENWMMR